MTSIVKIDGLVHVPMDETFMQTKCGKGKEYLATYQFSSDEEFDKAKDCTECMELLRKES